MSRKVTAKIAQDLYFAGLADGWFQISGGTPDDRYWAITDKGREAIS